MSPVGAQAVSRAVRQRRHGRHMTSITSSATTPPPSTGRATPRRRATPLLLQLDREWGRVRRRPAALRRVRGWDGDDAFRRTVGGVRCLDEVLAATQPHAGSHGSGDAILRRLLELATSEELAGRIVLQRLLPGLISQSRRWAEYGSSSDPSDIAIGAAWLAIRSFDVDVRSRHIAPALIADAMWIGFRRAARRRGASEIPLPTCVLAAQPAPPHLADPLTQMAAAGREHEAFLETGHRVGRQQRPGGIEQDDVAPRSDFAVQDRAVHSLQRLYIRIDRRAALAGRVLR